MTIVTAPKALRFIRPLMAEMLKLDPDKDQVSPTSLNLRRWGLRR
jgi:hypothetical protein